MFPFFFFRKTVWPLRKTDIKNYQRERLVTLIKYTAHVHPQTKQSKKKTKQNKKENKKQKTKKSKLTKQTSTKLNK